ncbi:hypothetical protein QE152_g9440 [Popillia japonica]|uniref:Uncharacterized protein n=1 Tax=Popillia japonica TaxID=7064 RepID=A0AAW1LYS6_POPJA
MCDSLDLVQVIHDPTRITPTSMSLVDLILVLSSASVISSGVLYDLVISDHSLTFVKLDVPGPSCEPRQYTLRDFSRFNYDSFLRDLHAAPWHLIYRISDINEKVATFNTLLYNLFEMHAPYKTIVYKRPQTPWMTDNLRLMMSLRNFTTTSIRREKRAYLKYISRNSDSKSLWKNLQSLNIYNRKGTHPEAATMLI